MSLEWIHENPPHWDEPKQSIVGNAEAGALSIGSYKPGDLIPGEWWRVEEAGSIVGYGWMDTTWGDAEMLLAVDPRGRGKGVGTFILDRLEQEATTRGLNYLYNVVSPKHPDRQGVTDWLKARRFEPSHDDDRLMRRVRKQAGATG